MEPLCPGDGRVKFTCYIFTANDKGIANLHFWNITFPGRSDSIILASVSTNSEIGAVSRVSTHNETHHFKYELELTPVRELTFGNAKVSCSYDGYAGMEEAVEILPNISYYGMTV